MIEFGKVASPSVVLVKMFRTAGDTCATMIRYLAGTIIPHGKGTNS